MDIKSVFRNMSKKNIILISAAVVVSILFVVSGYLFLKLDNDVEPVVVNGLTKNMPQQDMSRLQSYPCEKEPRIAFQQNANENTKFAEWMAETLFDMVKFDENEKFITNEKLAYQTGDGNYAVRGIYQIKQQDGTLKEQDMEFQYKIGEFNKEGTEAQLTFQGEKKLGAERIKKGE